MSEPENRQLHTWPTVSTETSMQSRFPVALKYNAEVHVRSRNSRRILFFIFLFYFNENMPFF